VDVILALVALVPIAALVLWLLRLPADEDEAEPGSLAAADWPHVRELYEREP
jgi:hypothetical protein